MFYSNITISDAQACKNDALHHTMSLFPLFLSSFSGAQKILGYVRPRSHTSSKKREKNAVYVGCIWRSLRIGTALVQCSDVIGLQMRHPKDEDPELKHNTCGYVHWLCCSSGSQDAPGQIHKQNNIVTA